MGFSLLQSVMVTPTVAFDEAGWERLRAIRSPPILLLFEDNHWDLSLRFFLVFAKDKDTPRSFFARFGRALFRSPPARGRQNDRSPLALRLLN